MLELLLVVLGGEVFFFKKVHVYCINLKGKIIEKEGELATADSFPTWQQ